MFYGDIFSPTRPSAAPFFTKWEMNQKNQFHSDPDSSKHPCVCVLQIATPARYTLTLGGTSLSVKYLRKHGYMSTPPPVKEYLQEKMGETRERFSERIEETKDKITEKLQETKDKVGFRKKNE